MTKREIASLVIKLMGVFVLLKSISYVPMVLSGMFSVWQTPDRSGAVWVVLIAVITVIVSAIPLMWGLLIIVLSDKVAGWLIKDDKAAEITGSMNKEDVMLVVCSCIGLYLIVTAFPRLIVDCSRFFAIRRAGSDWAAYLSSGFNRTLNLMAPVVQIALGVWLFAGAKGIVKLWKKIRSQ